MFAFIFIHWRWKENLPIYLSLLVDDTMGFFSRYPAMKPQLGHVDDCRRKLKKHFKIGPYCLNWEKKC